MGLLEESVIEYIDINEDSAQDNPILISRGTTAVHFIKFISLPFHVMELDEKSKL